MHPFNLSCACDTNNITMQQATEEQPREVPLLHNQFYQLHYPPRKQSNSPHRINHKLRSKSLSQVHPQPNPEEILEKLRPVIVKGSFRSRIGEDRPSLSIKKIEKDIPTMHKILSPSIHYEIHQLKDHPICSMRELEEKSRKNAYLKMAIKSNRQQKLKVNKLVQSTKQSEEVKIDYIELKKQDAKKEKDAQIKGIYDQFFKRSYEQMYGSELAFSKFQSKLKGILDGIQNHLFS